MTTATATQWILALLALQVTACGNPPAPPPAPIGPRAELLTTSIDLGTVHEPTHTHVRIANTGDAPLRVDDVSSGFAIEPKSWTIEPGDTLDVAVYFNPRTYNHAPNAALLRFQTNDPEKPELRTPIKAIYRPHIRSNAPIVQFGTVARGSPQTGLSTLLCRDADFQITRIDIQLSDPVHEVTAATSTPDGIVALGDPEYPGQIVLEFRHTGHAPTGAFSGRATIHCLVRTEPDAKARHLTHTIDISGYVQGDLVAEPRFIRVAKAFPNEDFDGSITLTSQTDRPFTVTAARLTDSSHPGLTISTEPYDNGAGLRGSKLILRGKAGPAVGMFRGTIEVTTDLPDEPPITIPFTGFVRDEPIIEGPGG